MRSFVVLCMLVCFSCFSFAGELRNQWQKAKDNAAKELKKQGEKSLSSLVKFNKDFGPSLDEFEKIKAKYKGLVLDTVLKNTSWHKPFYAFCQKDFNDNNWDFYFIKEQNVVVSNETTRANNMRKLYKDYITASGQKQLNIGRPLKEKWDAMNAKRFYVKENQAIEIIKETKEDALGGLADAFDRFITVEPGIAKKKCQEICDLYQKEVTEKLKGPKQLSAQKILLDALSAIEKIINK